MTDGAMKNSPLSARLHGSFRIDLQKRKALYVIVCMAGSKDTFVHFEIVMYVCIDQLLNIKIIKL